MKFIIHAGRHKTGTTYLQTFFRDNATTLLKRSGVLYPETGRGRKRNHHRFFKPVLFNGEDRSSLIQELCNEIEETKPETILMSSEVISRPSITENHLRGLQQDIPYNITPIFYLRRQYEYLLSLYSEHVKTDTLTQSSAIHDIDAELDHEQFLERYSAVFGDDRIIVRPYVSALSRGLVNDMSEIIGRPNIDSLPKPKDRNLRYTWAHIALLRLANRHRIARALVHRGLVGSMFRAGASVLPALFDRPRPLTEEEGARLQAGFAASNRRVARKYLRREALFPED